MCHRWQTKREDRTWRHLDCCGVQVYLRFPRRRAECDKCGWRAELVPWSRTDARSRFTDDFDDMAAFLAQRCDKTAITLLFVIAWRTVGRVIARVMERRLPPDLLDNLVTIGVDEISYRKHHHYLTLITDHVSGRIIWAKKGRTKEVLCSFFEELGKARCGKIRTVTVDLSPTYKAALQESVPHAQIVFDRFHVQRLVSKALDEVRREEWRGQRGDPEAARAVKKTRWILLKHPEDLTDNQRIRLAVIQRTNRRLYRAYLLKEQFAAILDRRQVNVARKYLLAWLAWASRSKLPAFVKAARTIRAHLDGILAYVRLRLSNGLIEGLNTKARLLTRRAYGFHSAEAVIAMIMLCCTRLYITPPHRYAAAS